jgi:hypothetical protein
MADIDRVQANAEARHAWNQNAVFWDTRMGEGNDFVDVLIWPVTETLLALHPGERVLDVAVPGTRLLRSADLERCLPIGTQFRPRNPTPARPAVACHLSAHMPHGHCGILRHGLSLL